MSKIARQYRLTPELVAAIERRTTQSGVSATNFVERTLRAELGLDMPPPRSGSRPTRRPRAADGGGEVTRDRATAEAPGSVPATSPAVSGSERAGDPKEPAPPVGAVAGALSAPQTIEERARAIHDRTRQPMPLCRKIAREEAADGA